MASKDYIYDFLDTMEKEEQEYLLLASSHRQEEIVIDVNFAILYEETNVAMIRVLERLIKKLKNGVSEDFDGEEWELNEEDE